MRIHGIRTVVGLLAAVVALSPAASAQAASFVLVYDDTGNQQIEHVVGTGTFSYDGPPVPGDFTFSSLSGLSFTAHFPGLGEDFSTSDLQTFSFDFTGIRVFDAGGGQFGLVFTSSGGPVGSLNADNGSAFLTHEPTVALDNPVGCCGGNGSINLYQLLYNRNPPDADVLFGDYRALTVTAVPVPASLILVAFGLAGLVLGRAGRHRSNREVRGALGQNRAEWPPRH